MMIWISVDSATPVVRERCIAPELTLLQLPLLPPFPSLDCPPPPSSEIAAKLRATQLDNIARAKRMHAQSADPSDGNESQDLEDGELDHQTRVDIQGTKSPKWNVTDSPGHLGNLSDDASHI